MEEDAFPGRGSPRAHEHVCDGGQASLGKAWMVLPFLGSLSRGAGASVAPFVTLN